MSTMGVSGGGFEFETYSVGGKWRWKVVANNVINQGQLFYVADVWTPFGRLVDVDTPIPGDVVTSMYESLSQFQQQLAPRFQLTGPGSFSLVVSEGEPIADVGQIMFTNAGAFGSYMNVSATPSAPWILVNPSSVTGVGRNQSSQIALRINPGSMLAANSPYSGVVNIQSNGVPPAQVSLNVTVLPRPAISVDMNNVYLTYNLTTQTPGGAQVVTVTNSGPPTSLLVYLISKLQNCSPWLSFTPQSDGPIPSGSTSSFILSLVSSGVPRVAGTYSETIRVTSNSASNNPVLVNVYLTVS